MNGYELSRIWFDWCFENPEKISPNHSALYFFAIEHCNRLGWRKKFGFPTEMAKDAIGIKSYKTYINTLNDLVEWGFVEMIEKSKNQYSANIIALVNFDKALNKALDKAIKKHVSKQDESTIESIASIDKHLTKEPLTTEPLTDNNKHQEIINIFNSVCINLTSVVMLTDERIKCIDLIEKKHGLQSIGNVFMKINESDYLNGGGKDGWKADFDWILNPTNFIKILEDKYKNRENGKVATKKSNVQYSQDFLNKVAKGLQS